MSPCNSQMNTDNANVAADIDAKQIVELPLNVRNVYGLATLNSSVQNTSEGQLLLGGGSNTTDTADQDISFMNFAAASLERRPSWSTAHGIPTLSGARSSLSLAWTRFRNSKSRTTRSRLSMDGARATWSTSSPSRGRTTSTVRHTSFIPATTSMPSTTSNHPAVARVCSTPTSAL
jgi:hypothetical protein